MNWDSVHRAECRGCLAPKQVAAGPSEAAAATLFGGDPARLQPAPLGAAELPSLDEIEEVEALLRICKFLGPKELR
eukprot:SAG31_NODE_1363_length_8627_cov_5.967402_1_plen_76_part_00